MRSAKDQAMTAATALPIRLLRRWLISGCKLTPYRSDEARQLSGAELELQTFRLSRLRPVVVLVGVVFALSASTSPAQEIGSRSQGLALARETCAPCHAIRKGGDASPNPRVLLQL